MTGFEATVDIGIATVAKYPSHSWVNRFRRILVRWEKLAETDLSMLHLVFGIIPWRATDLLK